MTPTGCTTVPFRRADIQLCTGISSTLPAYAPFGDLTLWVQIPLEGAAPLRAPLLLDRPPEVPGVQGPMAPVAGDALAIFTANFFHLGPSTTATLGGRPIALAPVDCTPSVVPGNQWCRSAAFVIPQGTSPGTYPLELTTVPGCSASSRVLVVGAPSVSDVSGRLACANGGGPGPVLIHGAGFVSPRVFIGGLQVQFYPPCGGGYDAPSCDLLQLSGPLTLPPGTYPMLVENGTTPPLRADAGQFTIAPGPPQVWGPSPSIVYAGVDRKVLMGTRGVTGQVRSADLNPWNGGNGGGVGVAAKSVTGVPDGVLVEIPSGLAPGLREIVIHDDSPQCPGIAWYQPVDSRSSFAVVNEDFETGTGQFGIDWSQYAGPAPSLTRVPRDTGGMALHAASTGTFAWSFGRLFNYRYYDLGPLRFDFRRSGTGAARDAPDVEIFMNGPWLETRLSPPPSDAWTHYELRLDDPAGWSVRDSGTLRPATAADLRAAIDFPSQMELRLNGLGTLDTSDASLDNVVLELFH